MSVLPPIPPSPGRTAGPDDGGFGEVLAFVVMCIFFAYLIRSR